MRKVIMGNHAVSYGVRLARAEVIAAYPITPQTQIVEILSEATATRDRRQKLFLYGRFGLPEYGIVDPEAETVRVFRLVKRKYPDPLEFRKEELLTPPLLPGLSLSLSEVVTG